MQKIDYVIMVSHSIFALGGTIDEMKHNLSIFLASLSPEAMGQPGRRLYLDDQGDKKKTEKKGRG